MRMLGVIARGNGWKWWNENVFMKANVYFKETQRLLWDCMPIFLIMSGCTCIFLYGVVKQIIFGLPFGIKPASNTALLLCLGLCLLMTLPFILIRLETRIKEDGVYVKFFPFHLFYKRYAWSEISKLYVKQYVPVQIEFWLLGFFDVSNFWGIWRTRYAISGNMGLQLEFASGRRLLIGTNKRQELTEALKMIGKLE